MAAVARRSLVNRRVVKAFHNTALLRRDAIFGSDALMPITATDDAKTSAPGWVGAQWAQGTLLVGINPGGGGDNYRRNSSDDDLYKLLRAFRDAESSESQQLAFERMCAAWTRIQRGHNIWRVVGKILESTGEAENEIAFMNVLPFRTRMDKAPTSKDLQRAWDSVALPQIQALRPRRIISLGKKAWDVMARRDLPTESGLILFKRGIGDSYIPQDSQEVLRTLARERE